MNIIISCDSALFLSASIFSFCAQWSKINPDTVGVCLATAEDDRSSKPSVAF